MADFTQLGGIPQGYDSLLNSARQQLVRMPDGTYAPMPQFGGATNIEDLYRGILPPQVPGPGLASRSVQTVPVDSYGQPQGFSPPSMAATMGEQRSGARPAITQGTQPAGAEQMPPGARPSALDSMFAQMGFAQPNGPEGRGRRPPTMSAQVWDPFGTSSRDKDPARLMSGDPRMAFNGDEPNSALDAIDLLTGSGNSTFPRSAPMGFRSQGGSGSPARAPIPMTPSPRLRGGSPSIPMPPSGGNIGPITFKRGDTVGKLAKGMGITVNAFADLYGIADPNKIRAGATVIPQVPQPRTPSPAQRTPPSANPSATRWDRASGGWV